MKRISLVLLAITVMAVLAISASAANTVMYSGGGAAQNLVQGDAGALVIELKFDGEDAENPQTFNVDDSDALYVRFFVEDADALTGNGQIEISLPTLATSRNTTTTPSRMKSYPVGTSLSFTSGKDRKQAVLPTSQR